MKRREEPVKLFETEGRTTAGSFDEKSREREQFVVARRFE
jgi:hypothetical protein